MKIIIKSVLIFLLLSQNSSIQATGSIDPAFIVEVPFYCSPPKIQNTRELIKEEAKHFQKKVQKHPEKGVRHEKYKFNEKDFAQGQEPYRIAGDEFRGFLKLYKYEKLLKIPASFDNPRAHEKAKPIKEKTDNLLKSILENETTSINQYIQLFRSEAFGQSAEESQSHFQMSMRMMLLLNRYQSISSTLNKSLKLFNDGLDQDKNVLMLRGFWEPKWEKKIGTRWKPVPIKEVRHFFLEYLKHNEENAMEFLMKNEGDEGRLKGVLPVMKKGKKNKKKITLNTHVPYQELREALRTHPLKEVMVKELKKENQGKVIYEAIHDSDLVGLRGVTDGSISQEEIGLYSHYEKLIQEHRQPDLLTTGYRAVDDDRFRNQDYFRGIYTAIEEDRYVRAALSKVDPRLTYYSEPNLLVKIPPKKSSMPYSFLDNLHQWLLGTSAYSFKKYNPHESLNILKQLYERDQGPPSIIFDPTHPVKMKLPERMLVNKHTGTPFKVGHHDQQINKIIPIVEKEDYRFLKISESVSQSPLSFRDYSMVIYSQLGFIGENYYIKSHEFPTLYPKVKNPDKVFNSILCALFNSYDPIMLIENLHLVKKKFQINRDILETTAGRIHFVSEHFDELTQGLPIKFKEGKNENVNFKLKSLNEISNKEVQLQKLKSIFNPVFQKDNLEPMTILINAAKAMGSARNNHIKLYYDFVSSPSPAAPQTSFPAKSKKSSVNQKKTHQDFSEDQAREYIKKMMKDNNMNQKAIGVYLGYSPDNSTGQAAVSNFLSGKASPIGKKLNDKLNGAFH